MDKRLTCQGAKGRESFTVTLPKEWVVSNGLDKSRLISMDVAGNSVIISGLKKDSDRKVILTSKINKSLRKVLPCIYRQGVNEIELMIHDSSLLEIINEVVSNELVGFEIIEQSGNSVIIRDITKDSSEDFRVILRRIFLLVIELSVSDDKFKIKALNNSVSKLVNYCKRVIVKHGLVEYEKMPFYFLLVDQLEKLSDEFNWLGLGRSNAVINEVRSLLRGFYELFYKFDVAVFDELASKSYSLKNELKLSNSKGVTHLHNIARLINSLLGTAFSINY